jgi:UDP-N-acetylmuramate--alanine ligase
MHVHFLGIGGTGLSPLAQLHLARGGTVTGSDQEESPRVAALRARGVRVRVGTVTDPDTLADELAGADLVVASSALPDSHPEIVAARRLGLPVRRRSDWLPEVTAPYRLVAVAGSHGKTTTSAMLALVLRDAGIDPTAVVGAEVDQLGGNAIIGGGDVFVLESDEYGGAFANLDPLFAIITNVEWEHPDLFPDEAAVRAAFTAFAARVRPGGRLVVCGDDPGVAAVRAALAGSARPHAPVLDYGFDPGRHWRAVGVEPGPAGGSRATALRDGAEAGILTLAVPGRHIVLDALAVLAVATELGVPVERALGTLGSYRGAARRFQTIGTASLPPGVPTAAPDDPDVEVEVVDDYAHHPTEIRATLAAARQRAGGRQVWAVLQPHTFTRLAALMDGFAAAFAAADRVYVTDIYAARERDDLGLHASHLAKRIHEPAEACYVPWPELVDRLAADLRQAGDPGGTGVLLLTLGAGTITTVGPRLLTALRSAA